MQILSQHILGDMTAIYLTDEDRIAGFLLVPRGTEQEVQMEKGYKLESLVQVRVTGDSYSGGFSAGHTMRNSSSAFDLKYDSQSVQEGNDQITIVTRLKSESGQYAEHHLTWHKGYGALAVKTLYRNDSDEEIVLEMLSSFSIGSLTPFDKGEAPHTLVVHRLRSKWSNEARLESLPAEDLQLEPTWARHGVQSIRFGQVGSMPVRKFFPFIAIEDVKRGVVWGAQLACPGSWQIEVYRRDDAMSISGGLADYEFGHWRKRLGPGEEFTTPTAHISVVRGNVNTCSQRLTSLQERALKDKPAIEEDLPVVFNEYCTTWGRPSHERIADMLSVLKNKGIKYFVIDAGWYASGGKSWDSSMGDWNVSEELFPGGLAETVKLIREHGMIPGIWFEFEVCGEDSNSFHKYADHFLTRDGHVLTGGKRRFWDMRDPWVIEHLADKVIVLLRENGFGYLKIDYNEPVGIGCDGAESYGEGLRQHLEGTQQFMERISQDVPGIVIENCSSGGHRHEPSMMGLVSMVNFSDAHECVHIPIVAANLHRAILPRQSQVWAVLRKTDSVRRLTYSLAATFLGRMCLSGDVTELSDRQWEVVNAGISFYKQVAPIIKHGTSYWHGPKIKSYRFPEGWQAIVRIAADGKSALAVMHTFGGQLPAEIRVPLPETLPLSVRKVYAERSDAARLDDGELVFKVDGNYQGMAVYMEHRE